MAYEWEKVELYGANNDGQPRRYTITSTNACSKGELLALVDPRTASNALVTTTMFAGVASIEKNSTDDCTSIPLWTQGVFEVTASEALVIGNPITGTGGTWKNTVISAPSYTSGANLIGYSLEAASALEKINVRLDL